MHPLLIAGAVTLAMKLAGIGLLLLATMVMTRALGADAYGVYIFTLSLVAVFAEPQFAALQTVAVRYGSIDIRRSDFDALTGLRRRLRRLSVIGAVIVAIALSVTAAIVGEEWGGAAIAACLIGAALPFMQGYNRVSDGLLRARGAIVAGQFPKLLLRPLLLLGYVLVAVRIAGADFDAGWAMAMQLAAAATAAGVYAGLIRKWLPLQPKGDRPIDRWREWRYELPPLFGSSILKVVDNRIAILMLGILAAPVDAGQFQVAFRLAELIILTPSVASLVIEPRIARCVDSGDTAAAQRTITAAARWVFGATLASSAGVILLGPWLLGLFGAEFVDVASTLAVLAIAQTLRAGLGMVIPLLDITGYARVSVVGTALGVAIQLGLCIALIPSFGPLGAAWAVLISNTITKVYLMWRVYRCLGLYTTVLGAWVNPSRWRGRSH